MLFNPGGPGRVRLRPGQRRRNDRLRDGSRGRFDLVGFDPRASTARAARLRRRRHLDAQMFADDTPDDAGEMAAATVAQQCSSAQCRAGVRRHAASLLDREHGPGHGQDPRGARRPADLLHRHLLRHLPRRGLRHVVPRRVRAMVLDSAYEPTGDTSRPVVDAAPWLRAGVRQLGGVVRGGSGVRLQRRRRGRPLGCAHRPLEASRKSDDGRPVNQVAMETATISALYSEHAWPALGAGGDDPNANAAPPRP